jgi:hypothetical protein
MGEAYFDAAAANRRWFFFHARKGHMRTRKKHGHVGNQRLWFDVPATGKNRQKYQQCDRSQLARGARRGA